MPKRLKPDGDLNPEAANDVLMRLLAVTKGGEFQLSPQMLEEIHAISVEALIPNGRSESCSGSTMNGPSSID